MEGLTTLTPVEIDTRLAEIYAKRYRFQSDKEHAWNSLVRAVKTYLRMAWHEKPTPQQIQSVCSEIAEETLPEERTYDQREIARAMTDIDGIEALIEKTFYDEQTLDEEYVRRGRWTRAFLVTNAGGHVHKSMHCSTCFETTRYHWITEMSDHTEEEIVEAAGERACTVCYPSAPVEVLNRPTRLFTPDEVAKQKAAEERAAKKAEREAAKITLTLWDKKSVGGGHQRHADGTTTWSPVEYGDRTTWVTYQTERALSNDLGALVREHHGAYAITNGFETPVEAEHREANIDVMVSALEQRGVDAKTIVDRAIKRAAKEQRG